jgi:hypothetical protein
MASSKLFEEEEVISVTPATGMVSTRVYLRVEPGLQSWRFGPMVNRLTTRCTPSGFFAISTAFVRPARPVTVPVKVTTCLLASTLMSVGKRRLVLHMR